MISSPPPVLFRLALHGQPTTKCFANRTPSTRDASMPNNKHVAILKKGAEIWNAWRDENPNIRPASRFTAGAAEFFILSQSGVRLSKKFAHVGAGSDRLGREVQSTV
jgi:hypothetical protein